MKRIVLFAFLAVVGSLAAERDPAFSPGYFWMWNTKLDPAALIAQLEDNIRGIHSVTTILEEESTPEHLLQTCFWCKRSGLRLVLYVSVYITDKNVWCVAFII